MIDQTLATGLQHSHWMMFLGIIVGIIFTVGIVWGWNIFEVFQERKKWMKKKQLYATTAWHRESQDLPAVSMKADQG